MIVNRKISDRGEHGHLDVHNANVGFNVHEVKGEFEQKNEEGDVCQSLKFSRVTQTMLLSLDKHETCLETRCHRLGARDERVNIDIDDCEVRRKKRGKAAKFRARKVIGIV